MSHSKPIRLGMLGAGLFARDAHLPALLSLGDTFEIVAIYSRSEKSAAAFNEMLPNHVPVYHDPLEMLGRADIDAVDILMPISVMPDMVKMALAAGKHVFSEKPIAPDFETGRDILAFYDLHHAHQVWMVGENWRTARTIVRAAELVRDGAIGQPLIFSWAIHAGMTPDNRYYQTIWRRDESHPGGYLLDGGVHFVAALRTILGEVEAVSAFVRQMRPDLPPADTLSATLHFESGLIGTLALSYAAKLPWVTLLTIVGSEGVIEVNLNTLKLLVNGEKRESMSVTGRSIDVEFDAFAAAIWEQGSLRENLREALQDLAVVEALLLAAQTGEQVTPVRVVPHG